MNSNSRDVSFSGFQFSFVIKGFLWAFMLTVLLGIIFSMLLQFTSFTESLLSSYSSFIFFISILLGAVIGSKSAGCKGIWHGISVALLFWCFTIIISLIWSFDTLSFIFLAKRLGLTIGAGGLGGIIGIGLANQ